MVPTFISQLLENYFALSELDDTSRPQCSYYIFSKTSCLQEDSRLWHSTRALFFKGFYVKLVIFEKKGVGLGKLPQEKKYFNGWPLVKGVINLPDFAPFYTLGFSQKGPIKSSLSVCVCASMWNQCCFESTFSTIFEI